MFFRLAFSVAAHLETDILIVDELLAVGDAEFQRRCLGRMESYGQSGRTVLFVSHSMPTIARLCPRLLLLDRGRMVEDGPTDHVIGVYLHGDQGTGAQREWTDPASAPGDAWARLRSLRIVDGAGVTSDVVDVTEEVGIEVGFDVLNPEVPIAPWIDLYTEGGIHVFSAADTEAAAEPRPVGRYVTTAWIPEHLLNEGSLHVTVSLRTPQRGMKAWKHAEAESALALQVVEQADAQTARGPFAGRMAGPVRPLLRWTSDAVGADTAALAARRRSD